MLTVWILLLAFLIKYYMFNEEISLFKQPKILEVLNNIKDKYSHDKMANKYVDFVTIGLLHLPKLPAIVHLLLILLPLLGITLCLDQILYFCLGGIGKILFSVLLFAYMFMDNHTNNSHNDYEETEEKVINLNELLENELPDRYNSSLITAHEQLFGLIFWFLCLGPCGVMLYWLLTNIREEETNFYHHVKKLHGLGAWVPARLTGLIYALVGNFVTGFSYWLKCMRLIILPSSKVLLVCGQAALVIHKVVDNKEIMVIRTGTKQLIMRALVAWIVFGCIVSLMKW